MNGRMKMFGILLLTLTIGVSQLEAAGPADSEVVLREVLERLEALEQDNLHLRRELESARQAPSMPAGRSAFDQRGVTTTGLETVQGGHILRGPPPLEAVILEHEAGTASESSFDAMIARQNERIEAVESGWKLFQQKSGEKKFPTVAVNGAFQADVGWFHQDDVSRQEYGRIQDGAGIRRARISAKGSVTETVNYMFQVDFGAFGRPTFTDIWLEQTNVPILGNVRIGQWKQPFSLEVVSSYRYTTFMERSVLFQPFTAFRHIGVGFYDWAKDESMTWAASVFRSGQDQFANSISTDGGWGTAERVTFLPYWNDNGRGYLHLGAAHFFNSPPRDTVNFRTIPEFFIGANAAGAIGTSAQAVPGGLDGTPFFVATGNLNVTGYNVLGTELLWVAGPVSLQSEVMVNFVDQGQGRPSAILPGAYAQLGYFLTGEHRPYDRKAGAIDRIMPFDNFKFSPGGNGTGWGAWELAARWSYLDLNDQNIRGGTIMDGTLGVNWYWNPFTKVVFNYVRSMPDTPAFARSSTDMFGLRAQIDF